MDMELETFFSIDTQVEVFLISCIVGLALGLIYDIFRVFRIIIPHNIILVSIEDFILLSGYGIFLVCFAFSLMRGQIRFFFIIGNLLGFILWFFTLGSIITKTIKRLKEYIIKFLKIVLSPIKKLYIKLKNFKSSRVQKKLKKTQKST